MPHTISYNPQYRMIETKFWGELGMDDARQIIEGILQAAGEHGCFLCLSDYREAILKLSTMQIYEVPRIISDVSNSLGVGAHQFKRALVVKNLEDFRFFETVTWNQGQTLKLFLDIDEARRWLLEDGS